MFVSVSVDRERARAYSRLKDRLALLGMAISILSSALFVFTGRAAWVNRTLLPSQRPSLQQRLVYVASLSGISWLAGLPLSFFSGYVVEKRYGLSNQSVPGWVADAVKSKAISTPVELGIIEGMYLTMRRWPRGWWLACSAAVMPLTALFAQLFPVLIAPRFNTYEPLRDCELASRLQDLTSQAGVPVADVVQMDMSRRTTKANAFFTGLGRTKRIVLADTLLDEFTPEQVEAVVAHEIAHQVHRDIWRFVVLSGLFTVGATAFVDTVTRQILRAIPSLAGTDDLSSHRSLPVIGLVLSLVGIVLAPFQLAYSRHIERKADRYAINLTGDPHAYANAMSALGRMNLADPRPPRPITLLLHSHPPLAERIEAAENVEYQQMFGNV
jgi:STE24 endopeptidase